MKCIILQVFLCHREAPFPQSSLPDDVIQASGIREVVSDGAILDNNDFIQADTMIICTGYHYFFPFLSPNCQLEVTNDEVVYPLYKHLVNARHPTMSLIGIPKSICPFPLFNCQARFIVAYLSGEMSLPGVTEMESEVKREYEALLSSGKPPGLFHVMKHSQWAYNDLLASMAGFEPLAPVIGQLYSRVADIRSSNYTKFRNWNFRLLNDMEFAEKDGE